MTTHRTRGGAFAMTRRDVEQLYPAIRDQHRYLQHRRDPEGKTKEQTLSSVLNALRQTAGVAAGSGAVGFLAGYLDNVSIGQTGIPIGLAAGVVAHSLAFADLGGSLNQDLHNFGDGALGTWLGLWAAGQGTLLRLRAEEAQNAQNVRPAPPPQQAVVGGGPYGQAAYAQPPPPPSYARPREFAAPSQPYTNPSPYGGQQAYGAGPEPLSEAELQAIAAEAAR